MLNTLIKFALHQRLLVIAIAFGLVGIGTWQFFQMPIDVFPDLNRPRVVIMTEAPGMAPEEVETLITFPIETTINGANGVEAVRSSSGVGISVIYVEFAYGTDVYTDRQIVAERMQLVQDRLPSGIQPQLAPISSILGQILMLGMWTDNPNVSPMELRTEADWIVRQRLLTIPGVSQVFTMGGERKQFQVRVNPDAMTRYGVTLEELESAVSKSNENGTGGYLDQQGPSEFLVRSLGRIQTVSDLREIPITIRDSRPVLLSQVAEVREGAQVKRGDASAFVKNRGWRIENTEADSQSFSIPHSQSSISSFAGGPAVVLTVNKQPGADTRAVTDSIVAALEELKPSLSPGVRIETAYSQKSFIDRAIKNVEEALRDGVILVVIVLFLFLLNVRTTFITLTAIPLSLVMTALIFAVFGLSINTMTLGGIAVAIGELVDDAIVDVENIFRRLKENHVAAKPLHPLLVVYRASSEVRRSIVFSTMIVILVFLPLFALGGMEGKLFTPLGVAYIVSILASLLVSLTVTPILSYWLLGSINGKGHEHDGIILRGIKFVGERVIRFSLAFPWLNLGTTVALVVLAGLFLSRLERDFLPPFNEGTVQLNVVLPPGTSLTASNTINRTVELELMDIPDVQRFVRRTGRAELDEHAEGVNMSEYLIELDPDSSRSREQQLQSIRSSMDQIPGIVTATEQPIAHLISHMLSGVKAQVGVKIYGDDLDLLRQKAEQIKTKMALVPGVTDLMIEPQVIIPQLRIEMERDQLKQLGLQVNDVNAYVQTAMNGKVVSEVLDGMRTFDLTIRLQENYREDINALQRLPIRLPEGGTCHLATSLASTSRVAPTQSIEKTYADVLSFSATSPIVVWSMSSKM